MYIVTILSSCIENNKNQFCIAFSQIYIEIHYKFTNENCPFTNTVGYNIGIMNSPADFMKDWCNQTVIQRYDLYLTENQLETLWTTIISIFLVGGCVGSLFAASLADKFGRFV